MFFGKMKGYSRSKEDYREKLVKKYRENAVYTVTKSNMKEAIYVEGDSCAKCQMMKPHTQKWAEINGYEFQTFRFDDVSVKEFDIQAVPMLILKEDGVVKDILDMEGIVNLIVTKK